jgi:hypothetical protein
MQLPPLGLPGRFFAQRTFDLEFDVRFL